jgi:F-type H+-transporting ATPase subunit b
MEGISQLGINVPLLITQLVTFVILLVVLRLVAYKPLMRMMDERSRRIKESMEQAETVREQSEQAEEQVKAQLAEASREGQERLQRAIRAGDDVRAKAQEDAKAEAEALLVRARSEIQQERDEAINEVRRSFADLTVLAAGKVIEQSLDKEKHKELIDKVLEESSVSSQE